MTTAFDQTLEFSAARETDVVAITDLFGGVATVTADEVRFTESGAYIHVGGETEMLYFLPYSSISHIEQSTA